MGKPWPADQIRIGGSVDSGRYLVEVESIGPRPTKDGKYQISGTYRVVEPSAYVGLPVFDNFTIGTPDDRNADDPLTWVSDRAVGARRFRELLARAGVNAVGDVEADCDAVTRKRLIVEIEKGPEPEKRKDGTDNPYAWEDDPQSPGEKRRRIRTQVTGMWATGAVPVGPVTPPPKAVMVAGASQPSGAERQVACPTCGERMLSTQFSAHIAENHTMASA